MGTQEVSIFFMPAVAGPFRSTVTVQADHTSGANTLEVTATAMRPAEFSSVWQGALLVERCDGDGSLHDAYCRQGRGDYPVGASLPIVLNAFQSAATVIGSLTVGDGPRPVLNGELVGLVEMAGSLSLAGRIGSTTRTLPIRSWSAVRQGDTVAGSVMCSLAAVDVPGNVEVSARLSGVTRR